MKIVITLSVLICLSLHVNAQFVLIPDADFEQALIDLNLDDLIDGQVLLSNIATVEALNVDGRGISDLTGIQGFESLIQLSCKQNSLTTLDITQNSELMILDCRLNLLTALDLTQNSQLLTLRCSDNALNEIDITENPLFRYFYCSNNPLTGLDLSLNPDLYWLECDNTGLIDLDVTQNLILTILKCNGNELSTLDISQNGDLHTLICNDNELVAIDFGTVTSLSIISCENNLLTELETSSMLLLETLNCSGNQIAQLNLLSTCLQVLICEDNQMENLDMSQSTTMTALHCSNNPPLEWIDLRNNLISNVSTLVALNDPNLTCIYVDDAAYDHGVNWQFDTLSAMIVETEAECMMSLGFSDYPRVVGPVIYPNPFYGHFSVESEQQVKSIRIFDVRGNEINVFPFQTQYSIELPQGMYVVKVEYEKYFEIIKLFAL